MSALHPKNTSEAKAFEEEGVKSQLGQYVDVQERVVNEMKKDSNVDKEQLEREISNLRSLKKEQELLSKDNH
ncbi:hypothetical protein A0J61_00375 [Choanephora cucurbitarum]|uniref:Uncharacterized protein n=1 Tax=Choanephora cucurbitarum TaxID=101091 RepID=A0A1C7NRB8_9FUNG|nr:hypothetical protein A0J61_00375 [Choanephora cucurbitarum]